MPPSGGRGTKRKVATPAPEPDPVADVDTEGEGQEEEGLSNTDANGNEEGASSLKPNQESLCGYQCCPQGIQRGRRRKKIGALPAATSNMLSLTRNQEISSLISITTQPRHGGEN